MKFEFFGLIDILATLGWFLVFAAFAYIIRIRHSKDPDYKLYLPNFYVHILLGMFFGLIYTVYYEDGGDTVYYWVTASRLNDVFWDNPVNYLSEILSNPEPGKMPNFYDKTGSPPHWIYYENESFFVAKVASIFSFFSLKSYFALNLMFSVISGWVSWRFFRFIKRTVQLDFKFAAIACLFLPTVGFWCSGVIKDTVAYCATIGLVIGFFYIISGERKKRFLHLILILFCSYILLNSRAFMLVASYVPLMVIFVFKLNQHKPFLIKLLTRITGIALTAALILFYLNRSNEFGEFSSTKVMETAEVIHNDFKQNETYTGKRYDLGLDDFNTASLIRVMPLAILTTLYRPFLWEVDGVLMLLNGLESTVLLFFTLQMIFSKKEKRINLSHFNHSFYLYALIFILVLGFFVGITSILFGILARLKAPILPFFVLLIFSYKQAQREKENSKPKKIEY
jgi:hypothetical protein